MGVWAYPGTVEKASRLSVILSAPVSVDAVCVFDDLIGDDEFLDSVADLKRAGGGDVTMLASATLDRWLGQLDTFVRPWEHGAVDIVRAAVDGVEARFLSGNASWASERAMQP